MSQAQFSPSRPRDRSPKIRFSLNGWKSEGEPHAHQRELHDVTEFLEEDF